MLLQEGDNHAWAQSPDTGIQVLNDVFSHLLVEFYFPLVNKSDTFLPLIKIYQVKQI